MQAGAWIGLESPLGFWSVLVAHVVFNTSVVALIVRARFVGMGQTLEEASYDLGAGPLSTFRPGDAPAARTGDPRGRPAGVHVLVRRLHHVVLRRRGRDVHVAAQDLRVAALRVSPAINATAAMILGLTLAAIVVAYLVLRRPARRARGGVPGV